MFLIRPFEVLQMSFKFSLTYVVEITQANNLAEDEKKWNSFLGFEKSFFNWFSMVQRFPVEVHTNNLCIKNKYIQMPTTDIIVPLFSTSVKEWTCQI